MKASFKFLYTGIAGLVVATGFAVMPAIAELSNFSPPTDPVDGGFGGFPQWYQDSTGLKLDLCLAADATATPPGFCLTSPPDLKQKPSVSTTAPELSNFPDEAFYWNASAKTTTRTTPSFKAILVLATEGAFPNGDVIDGDQIVFNRTRIRVLGGLVANRKYKVIYPYGEKVLTATAKDPRKPATINFTEDFGCGVAITACNFGSLLVEKSSNSRILNPIGKPWLTWTTYGLPPEQGGPPVGYIGDPGVDHEVTGGLNGNNIFKVIDLTTGATIAETKLFSVSGKVSTAP